MISSQDSRRFYSLILVALALVGVQPVSAAIPGGSEERKPLIGQPTELMALPAKINLDGPHAVQQIVLTGKYADGTLRDLSNLAKITAEPADLLSLSGGSFVRGTKNGSGNLVVEVGGKTTKIPFEVKSLDQVRPVSFRNEVVGALNVGGCNAGACHGTPSGKNGFRLSLRGFDPALDFTQITRDILGRRGDSHDPMGSLLLQKGLGRVPHEGGARFGEDSVAVEMVSTWFAEGMRDDPKDLATLKKIDVLPGSRVLKAPARWQQLAVMGQFSDGAIRDVTRLTVFSSSDASIADVSPSGLVEFKQSGEVAILCRYLEEMQAVRITYLEPREGFTWSNPQEVNFVDKFVFAKLKQMSILPSDTCTDAEFLRRAYMDVAGMLPPSDRVKQFLDDKDPNKRAKLVDELLLKPEYADFWALKWADVFRSSRKTIQLKGASSFQQWLRDNVSNNTPFDSIVKEMLTSNGSTYANPPANYYRIAKDPQSLAETTAQLFFGVRMQCAKCHNHPFERWTQDDYYSTAAWFARVRLKKDTNNPAIPNNANSGGEFVFSSRDGEVTQPRSGKTMQPKFLGGTIPEIPKGKDRREVFADWLASPGNPFFAKSVANRIWFHLNGKGIVDPVDDFRESNPSCNDELLDALAKEFTDHKFDVKHLIRTIMTSRTYQLSSQPNDSNRDDGKYFSHAVTKLLTAEQLLDAICDVTALPEKFQGLPMGTRAIQLPDGEVNHPFLKTFGQPARELACECERESDSNLAQALQLINGPTINEKLRNPANRLGKLLEAKKADSEILDALYLVSMSRLPTDVEKNASMNHLNKSTDKRKAWEDVQWALFNTREFLFRH